MTSAIQQLQQSLPTWGVLAAMLLGVALMVALVAFGGRKLVQRRRLRRPRRVLRKLATDMVDNVWLPDPVEGALFADYVALTPAGLVVLNVNNYRGLIFGGDSIDHWTQVVNGHSFRFENPLYRNQARKDAVKTLAPDVPVHAYVVFTEEGEFPRQIPKNVFMLRELGEAEAFRNPRARPPDAYRRAWDTLKGALVRSA